MKNEDAITIHLVMGASGTWAHTHGLHELGLPELEIRDVPRFLGPAAGRLLNEVAGYLIEQQGGGRPVELGHSMRVGSAPAFRFVQLRPVKGAECHFRRDRWALVDDPEQACDCCGGEPARRGRARRGRRRGRPN